MSTSSKNMSQKIRGQLWIHYQGQTYVYDGPQESRSRQKKNAAATGDIVSPMPGKITKILKQAGDGVSVGQAVIVMEAMKMEYTLKASVDGAIETLNCKVGDQVVLGKTLAKIK